jgi:catechol 2,3-dioxygenase-like lactoylglutathione lyase family enzyme
MAAVVRYIVDDVDQALAFYRALGFRLTDRWGPPFAIVKRRGLSLWLSGPVGTQEDFIRRNAPSRRLEPHRRGDRRSGRHHGQVDGLGGALAQQTHQWPGWAPGAGRRPVGQPGGGVSAARRGLTPATGLSRLRCDRPSPRSPPSPQVPPSLRAPAGSCSAHGHAPRFLPAARGPVWPPQ